MPRNLKRPTHPLLLYMRKHEITMEKMTEMLGVSRVTIWRWFHWKREPTLSQALYIHALTNVPLTKLAVDYFNSEFKNKLYNLEDKDLL